MCPQTLTPESSRMWTHESSSRASLWWPNNNDSVVNIVPTYWRLTVSHTHIISGIHHEIWWGKYWDYPNCTDDKDLRSWMSCWGGEGRQDLNLGLPLLGFPRWLSGKEFSCQCRRCRFDPWVRKIPWRVMATHSSILAWEIPWAEELAELPSTGSGKSWTWLSN